MTRLSVDYDELLIANLREEIPKGTMPYMSRDEAYKELKVGTGQDFGFDGNKWKEWIEVNGLPGRNIPPTYINYAMVQFDRHGEVIQECIHCGRKLIVMITEKGYKVYCDNDKCPEHPAFTIDKDTFDLP
jgi:hypothetical protein